jgi:hypothetical protein
VSVRPCVFSVGYYGAVSIGASLHSHERTAKNQVDPQSEGQVSRPEIEPSTSWTLVQSVTARPSYFYPRIVDGF